MPATRQMPSISVECGLRQEVSDVSVSHVPLASAASHRRRRCWSSCRWAIAGGRPLCRGQPALTLSIWVHDKGTGAMLAEIPVPQNASGSETTDYLMPYGILRGAPWPGCLSRSSLRYQWVVARLPASSPGIRDDFDSGAVADVYE